MLLLFVPVRAGVAWGAWCGEILGFVVGRRQRLTRLRLKVEAHFFNFKETFNKHYTGVNDKYAARWRHRRQRIKLRLNHKNIVATPATKKSPPSDIAPKESARFCDQLVAKRRVGQAARAWTPFGAGPHCTAHRAALATPFRAATTQARSHAAARVQSALVLPPAHARHPVATTSDPPTYTRSQFAAPGNATQLLMASAKRPRRITSWPPRAHAPSLMMLMRIAANLPVQVPREPLNYVVMRATRGPRPLLGRGRAADR